MINGFNGNMAESDFLMLLSEPLGHLGIPIDLNYPYHISSSKAFNDLQEYGIIDAILSMLRNTYEIYHEIE